MIERGRRGGEIVSEWGREGVKEREKERGREGGREESNGEERGERKEDETNQPATLRVFNLKSFPWYMTKQQYWSIFLNSSGCLSKSFDPIPSRISLISRISTVDACVYV